jgi:DNA polymerase-3 subunit chi
MTDVRFYHLTRTPLEAALPQMLEKTLERGQRAVVIAGSDDRVEALTVHLWTYRDRTFLPHGDKRDGFPGYQPIWLTAEDENPNGAEVLFLTDGARSANIGAFAVCAVLFDGNAPDALAEAREQWQAAKAAGHDVTYWQQTDRGGWEKRA